MQDKPPRPEDDSIGIVEAPRTVAYVASFGGFAVETSILTQARALREKLREDGQRFDVRALICTNSNLKINPNLNLNPGPGTAREAARGRAAL